jgi:hypothetical protein
MLQRSAANMITGMKNEEQIKSIKKLYPKLNDEECIEVAERLDQYLLLAWEMWQEEQKGPESHQY